MTRWKIALGAAVVVVAAAGGSLAAVNLSGGSQPEQVRLIAPSGVTGTTTTTSTVPTTVAPATTVPQAPARTAPAATTTTVARVVVPDVAGDTLVYAQSVLSQAGLTYTTVESGILVIGQEPVPGTSVPVGFAVTLTLGTR